MYVYMYMYAYMCKCINVCINVRISMYVGIMNHVCFCVYAYTYAFKLVPSGLCAKKISSRVYYN